MSSCGDFSRRLLLLVLHAFILFLVRLMLLFNDVTDSEVRVEIFVGCIMYCFQFAFIRLCLSLTVC